MHHMPAEASRIWRPSSEVQYMPFADMSMRGRPLNWRCAVKGMKCASRSLGFAGALAATFTGEGILYASLFSVSGLFAIKTEREHTRFHEQGATFENIMTATKDNDDPKITRFPDARERKALEKAHFIHQRAEPPKEPALNLPPAVKALCLINIAVFLLMDFFPGLLTPDDIYVLGFVPARYFSGQPLDFAGIVSPFTHMFIHGGWLHLGINIGTLMAFGAGLEKKIGARRLLLFYFITGLCGALAQALAYPEMEAPMVGASGAISGLFGGVVMLMYSEGLMGQGYRKLAPLIFIWIGISVFFGFFGMPGTDNPIAWTTHIGGFIGGLLLYKPISRLKIQH
jgi:membrane associated rhomboid family serine protease